MGNVTDTYLPIVERCLAAGEHGVRLRASDRRWSLKVCAIGGLVIALSCASWAWAVRSVQGVSMLRVKDAAVLASDPCLPIETRRAVLLQLLAEHQRITDTVQRLIDSDRDMAPDATLIKTKMQKALK